MKRGIWIVGLLFGCSPQAGDADTIPDGPSGWQPDFVCPGGPGCADADGALRVGVAVRSIVPACFEDWDDLNDSSTWQQGSEPFRDCGCDRLCPDDDGYPGPDEGEGDGVFQAAWIAGFANSRPATGVRGADLGLRGEGDGLDLRVVLLDQGSTRVAIVAMDAIGWMHDQVLRFREDVAAAGLGVDHLIVHSTHSHSAPDVMGIYGPSITRTGYDPAYADQVAASLVSAVSEAVEGLAPVQMRWSEVDAADYHDNGVANQISDTRDPVVIDSRIGVVRFVGEDEATVATVVHWANHPETIGGRNTLFTSDFVHALRLTVSEGSVWSDDSGQPGVGGTTVYLNGTVGGMMTSLRANIEDPTGAVWSEASWEKVDAQGQMIGEMVLDAIGSEQVAEAPSLRVAGHQYRMRVDNTGFRAMFFAGVFDHRTLHDFDDGAPMSDTNVPYVRTEVNLLELGPLRMITAPGEVHPEAFIGGYDGRYTPPNADLVRESNPNPPDVSQAPDGPYLRDDLGGELRWLLGLGNDELGYFIPPWNFVLANAGAYLQQAQGDHYEETNSLGPESWPTYEAEARKLLAWFNGEEVEE